MAAPRPRGQGFTLLEVMLAVAILSVAMLAIYSSEAGAVRISARARSTTTATFLARCKMAEVEEAMAREGFAVTEESGEDDCCEGGEIEGFRCEWTVERVELPDAIDFGGDDPLASITGSHAGDEASATDVSAALTGSAGADAIGNFAIQAAFPVLRPAIEEQVRRATVTVYWVEGTSERSFDVHQYLVADQGTQATPTDPVDNNDNQGDNL